MAFSPPQGWEMAARSATKLGKKSKGERAATADRTAQYSTRYSDAVEAFAMLGWVCRLRCPGCAGRACGRQLGASKQASCSASRITGTVPCSLLACCTSMARSHCCLPILSAAWRDHPDPRFQRPSFFHTNRAHTDHCHRTQHPTETVLLNEALLERPSLFPRRCSIQTKRNPISISQTSYKPILRSQAILYSVVSHSQQH